MTAKNIRLLFLYLYSALPVFFFATALACYIYSEVVLGGISWQNHSGKDPAGYEHFSPWIDIVLVPTVAGILLLPFLFIAQLLIQRRNWKQWLPAIVSYTLFFLFFILAGDMGWYVD